MDNTEGQKKGVGIEADEKGDKRIQRKHDGKHDA
jgi:hypothetical protein